ncbi:Na-translocating system protein MpsC family protein [Patulibacter sp.]|uniref:Na-translocating system protein MpsC family protein n=1 Tax=Patulibacter sp. TaxID=1912859 RepID=UPI00271941CE|nr:Na-translocating system protein MpsC family protein [Patulibacter sp.]MDO9407920.1 Na-translocating system protein MpsC family protein [Patulibacter sp.]
MQQAIATGIALVYKSAYGRGPTKVTAHALPGAVVVVLEDVTTPAEAMLLELGETDLVDTVHARLQRGLAPRLVAVVEDLTGRTVRSYVPGLDAANGTAVDTFLLAPAVAEA